MNWNEVTIIGNICNDIQEKELDSGAVLASFTVAVNEVWKDRDGERQEKAHFIPVTAWGRNAENIAKYFKKGSPILVNGSLDYREWENDEGEWRSMLGVKVNKWEFVPTPREKKEGGPGRERQSEPRRPSNKRRQDRRTSSGSYAEGDDEQIPF